MERLCAGFDLRAAAGRAAGIARPRTSDHVTIGRATDGCLLLRLTPANYKEIASACGLPVGTIRSRLSRGRETLRKLMGISPPQHSRASRPLRAAAAATMRQERSPPDCRFDITQEVGHLPLERSAHPRQHGNLLHQADLVEGRIDIRSKARGWLGSEGSWSSDPQRTEPLLEELTEQDVTSLFLR